MVPAVYGLPYSSRGQFVTIVFRIECQDVCELIREWAILLLAHLHNIGVELGHGPDWREDSGNLAGFNMATLSSCTHSQYLRNS
jgi:hypothetical protein